MTGRMLGLSLILLVSTCRVLGQETKNSRSGKKLRTTVIVTSLNHIFKLGNVVRFPKFERAF